MAELPMPVDDGAAKHLTGLVIPSISLQDSSGRSHNLGSVKRLVLYVYAATGVPGRAPALDPAPGWDSIPGAPGCTAQSLGFRGQFTRLSALGFEVLGVSAQPREEQRDFVARHDVPFPVLNDSEFVLASAMGLPTFTVGTRRFYKRLSLVAVEGKIVHVRYPVFPPHSDAEQIADWLESGATAPTGASSSSDTSGVSR